jgi:hypothetical protein
MNYGWRKSSYSSNGGGSCVEVGTWRKSSYSSNGGAACVEVGATPQRMASVVLIRDTTQDGTGPVLRVSAETWRAFTTAVRTDAAIS